MPDIFFGWHPIGAVIGRALYSDGFFFYQGCNVGENLPTGMGHPTFGENVLMCVNSTVLGNCNVGSNVILSANSYIKDVDIPDNTIVFGQYPNIKLKDNDTNIVLDLRR
jgi:serine O-acetyltransferase